MGHMVDRTHRDLSQDDIARVAGTYHAWRGQAADSPLLAGEGQGEGYADVPGFCKSAALDEVRKHGHVLTPGRYVGAEPQPDDGEPFDQKMARLAAQWRQQQAEARRLDAAIEANLNKLGICVESGERRVLMLTGWIPAAPLSELREHVPDAESGPSAVASSWQQVHEASELDLVLRDPKLERLGEGYSNLLETD